MRKPGPPVFRFLWIGPRGPHLKCFQDVHAFSGYVRQARDLLGWNAVEFRTPTLAVGVV